MSQSRDKLTTEQDKLIAKLTATPEVLHAIGEARTSLLALARCIGMVADQDQAEGTETDDFAHDLVTSLAVLGTFAGVTKQAHVTWLEEGKVRA